MVKLAHVLVVDDDPTTLFLHQLLLKRLEIAEELLLAHDGLEALELLGHLQSQHETLYPDLILLDFNMPRMSGLEFMQHYQALPQQVRESSTVVAVTTSRLPADMHPLQQLGVVHVLEKPLTKEKIAQMLERYFPHCLSSAGVSSH